MKFCYSTNGENFDGEFDSREEAISEAISLCGLEVGNTVYTAEMAPISSSQLVRADHIIDNITCAAADLAGEAGESYLAVVSSEHMDELEALIAAWMDRVEPIYFYGVENSTEHVITSADMESADGHAVDADEAVHGVCAQGDCSDEQ